MSLAMRHYTGKFCPMTKLLIAAALAFAVILLLIFTKTKKQRLYILLSFCVFCVILSAAQTFRNVPLILEFFHAKNQTFYQPEFARDGAYPDAILPLMVKGKTVYIKDDLDDYIATHKRQEGDMDCYYDDGKYWMYTYYHQNNLTDFLEASGANVVAEDKYNNSFIGEEQQADFEHLGYSNDLNRYLFPLSKLNEEWSNSFYYYWYYSTELPDSNIYVNGEGLSDAAELVVLSDDSENETWYVMTKDYYDRKVATDE